jgi:SAM-dependent methyltransferase
MVNSYSSTWFKLFLETQPYTKAEVAFLTRQLPQPPYGKILDVGCGQGRHASLLAERGYEVVGIDLNDAALDVARRHSGGRATYLQHDMRRLAKLPGSFDAVLSLWQSFGYFDEETNRDVLRQMSEKLRPNGRLILDIYHRTYFEKQQGIRRLEREGVPITISQTMAGNRLTAVLHYGDGSGETFNWQLFTPAEICQLATEFGLRCRLACTEADEEKTATPDKPRVQYVFEQIG